MMESLENNSRDQRLREAKEQVERERGFYQHLITYVLVNLGLFGLYLFSGSGYYWFVWPLIGWGIGLAFHAYGVFGNGLFFGKDWEDKRIKKLMGEDD